ncbi:uncharacterized protein LOC141911373 [Tubulanus polymorphus]|uniref:uncharacterized protein LOC141911373 n=1 Tax=Tubulanus polymorphus TaxID=672921 RepID=UPI003DA376BB
MWKLSVLVAAFVAVTAGNKQLVAVEKKSVFLYTRECEDETLHKTFKAGHVWKSRCIVWTCAVTPGGAFNIPVKLECENLQIKGGKESKECVPVGTTNLKIKRNDHLYKNCDCVWMFNQLQYHCPVEREHLEGKASPAGKDKKEVKKVTNMKEELNVSKKLDALKKEPKLIPKKAAGEKPKEVKKEEKKGLQLPLPAPDKKTKKEHKKP